MSNRILIVEDENKIRNLIKDYLELDGYKVLECDNGKDALEIFNKQNISLVILDIMIPKIDGLAVCREIRKKSNVPVIMLTAKSEDSDEILGFELGADEYITKPFNPMILMARIKVVLKRTDFNNEVLVLSGISIDKKAHKVFIDNKEVNLSPKEYDLLLYLVDNIGIALSREGILNSVWDYDYFGGLRTVDTHIKRLRLKLGNYNSYISTIRGYGYRFEVKND